MPLTTYEEARPWAKAIKEEVLARRMPKWHVVRGYGDFSNDPSLSPFEIALIAAWADGGAPASAKASAAKLRLRQGYGGQDGGQDGGQVAGDRTSAHTRVSSTSRAATRSLPDRPTRRAETDARKGDSLRLTLCIGRTDRAEPLLWLRNFDPAFAETYWLRNPIAVTRAHAHRRRGADPLHAHCSARSTNGKVEHPPARAEPESRACTRLPRESADEMKSSDLRSACSSGCSWTASVKIAAHDQHVRRRAEIWLEIRHRRTGRASLTVKVSRPSLPATMFSAFDQTLSCRHPRARRQPAVCRPGDVTRDDDQRALNHLRGRVRAGRKSAITMYSPGAERMFKLERSVLQLHRVDVSEVFEIPADDEQVQRLLMDGRERLGPGRWSRARGLPAAAPDPPACALQRHVHPVLADLQRRHRHEGPSGTERALPCRSRIDIRDASDTRTRPADRSLARSRRGHRSPRRRAPTRLSVSELLTPRRANRAVVIRRHERDVMVALGAGARDPRVAASVAGAAAIPLPSSHATCRYTPWARSRCRRSGGSVSSRRS